MLIKDLPTKYFDVALAELYKLSTDEKFSFAMTRLSPSSGLSIGILSMDY